MNIEFFDANVFIGEPAKGCFKPAVTAAELLEEVGASEIRRALAWHIAQHDCSPQEGNRLLSEAVSGVDALYGCWTILPPQTGEVIVDGFFERMKENHIFALRAFPDYHRFLLNRVTFGRFLAEVSERRIPLILSLEMGIGWDAVYNVLQEFPNLTCILCDIGVWNADRYFWPLLDSYSNLYVETSMLSMDAGALEAAVLHYGSERLLFGSGFPLRYPDAAVLQLLHADISDDDKRRIAYQNLDNLISGVRL